MMTLVENQYFPEMKVTWTTRDVQNLLQKQSKRALETNMFLKLLEDKVQQQGWQISFTHNDEILRLERIFWISKAGKDRYQQFNDAFEIDATYKTNRFGIPLVLLT